MFPFPFLKDKPEYLMIYLQPKFGQVEIQSLGKQLVYLKHSIL